MNDTTKKTHISQVGTVFVPVADQDRALGFYRDKLGFEKRADFSYGNGSRWVEVAPPGSTNAIALVSQSEGKYIGVLVSKSEGKSIGGDSTLCAFATKDIQADHATLRARGVDVEAEIAPDAHPPQFCFRDIDGNRFLMVQPG